MQSPVKDQLKQARTLSARPYEKEDRKGAVLTPRAFYGRTSRHSPQTKQVRSGSKSASTASVKSENFQQQTMSDLVRFQAEVQKFQQEKDFLLQSNNVSKLGLQYLKGQTEMLHEGNTAVTQEVEKLAKQTKTDHEHYLQNSLLAEQLRKANG